MSTDRMQPAFGVLLDWVEGRLETATADEVADQVAGGDARVRGTVRWLSAFIDTAAEFPLHESPPYLRQRLRQQFAQWSASSSGATLKPRTIETTQVFDSRRDLVSAGVRGVTDGVTVVHLAFTAEVGDVVLDVRPTAAREFRIDGQVLLCESSPAAVFEALVRGPRHAMRSVDGDELGRFRLGAVPVDSNELRLTNGEIELTIALDLGSTRM